MRKDTPRQYLRRIRGRQIGRLGRLAALFILITVVAMILFLTLPPSTDEVNATPVDEEYTPYYMTAEYQEMKRKEQEEAEAEAKALKESIEAYQEEQQRKAEEEFKAMQELYAESEEGELPYPFNTAPDICEADLEGFVYYEIPEEYSDYGGYLPRAMQEYLYSICQDAGYDYPTALAQIEKESAYQYDCIGAAGDTGYFQVIPKYHIERMEKLYATDMLNPYQNALVAIDYMAELLEKYDGNVSKALTAYNCGPSGAYKYYFSAGVDANSYAKAVLKKAELIRKELMNAESE